MTGTARRELSSNPEKGSSVSPIDRAPLEGDGATGTGAHGVEKSAEGAPFTLSPTGIGLCIFLAVGALFLVFEHRAHLLGAWPLVLLLLCLGVHFFMHRGHGGHASHAGKHGGRHYRRGRP